VAICREVYLFSHCWESSVNTIKCDNIVPCTFPSVWKVRKPAPFESYSQRRRLPREANVSVRNYSDRSETNINKSSCFHLAGYRVRIIFKQIPMIYKRAEDSRLSCFEICLLSLKYRYLYFSMDNNLTYHPEFHLCPTCFHDVKRDSDCNFQIRISV
jgi:hypothetical protein